VQSVYPVTSLRDFLSGAYKAAAAAQKAVDYILNRQAETAQAASCALAA